MIEIPRGAITAGEIAEVAEFFSFGTNDLTQTTLGLSRDDQVNSSGVFAREFMLLTICVIDRQGVGFHYAPRC